MNERVISPKVEIGGGFSLTDHFGRPVTHRSWGDRYLLIFFGFTHCKVVCPRALAKLSEALDQLGETAGEIRPLYITIDPDRDTPERMRGFLTNYPRFLGLTGRAAEIERVKHAYRVFAERRSTDDGYDMPHSAIAYLVASDGALAAHFVDALSAEAVAQRVADAIVA